jgi:hypothetical protein
LERAVEGAAARVLLEWARHERARAAIASTAPPSKIAVMSLCDFVIAAAS